LVGVLVRGVFFNLLPLQIVGADAGAVAYTATQMPLGFARGTVRFKVFPSGRRPDGYQN
jgi:hypothetical protein